MNVSDLLTELATGVSWLATKLKFSTVCCREELLAVELLITNVGPKSSLLQGSKVTHITFIPEIAAREWFIDMNVSGCFNDHLNRLMSYQRGQLVFSKSTSVRHTHNPSIHTSIYPIHGTKSDLRLLRSGPFFSQVFHSSFLVLSLYSSSVAFYLWGFVL